MNFEGLRPKIREFLTSDIDISEANKAPSLSTQGLNLSDNTAKISKVAILYVDICSSSTLNNYYDSIQLMRLYKSFHYLVSEIAIHYGAEIRNSIGDCIMAVFDITNKHCCRAVSTGIKMQRAIRGIFAEEMEQHGFKHKMSCKVGVDFGNALVFKVGTRGNDNNKGLVWGPCGDNVANTASKLTEYASSDEIRISKKVFERIKHISKFNEYKWHHPPLFGSISSSASLLGLPRTLDNNSYSTTFPYFDETDLSALIGSVLLKSTGVLQNPFLGTELPSLNLPPTKSTLSGLSSTALKSLAGSIPPAPFNPFTDFNFQPLTLHSLAGLSNFKDPDLDYEDRESDG